MQAYPQLLLDNQLCFRLYAATRAMTQAYQPFLAPLGLTYPQYLVMLVLWESDGLSVKDIGDRLHLDSGTLTPLLKRMEGQDLVRRLRSTKDERIVEIWLTEHGRAMQADAADIPRHMACRMGINRELASSLATVLDQVIGLQRGDGTVAEHDEPIA